MYLTLQLHVPYMYHRNPTHSTNTTNTTPTIFSRSFTLVPSLWNTTTLPPLSPVAKNSPSWLNSTVEIMSAKERQNCNSNYMYM